MTDLTPGTASRARGLLRSYVADAKHGPLPALLLLLTTVTGLIDAASVLSLGRVFVANMTGTIVFIGFGLVNTPGFSLAASLSALAGFLVGAVIGGGYLSRFGGHRGVLLRTPPPRSSCCCSSHWSSPPPPALRSTADCATSSSLWPRSRSVCRTRRCAALPFRTSRRRW